MELVHKVADRTLFSEKGDLIAFGESYVQEGGKVISLNEYETSLGLRDFTAAQRKKLAASGAAMSDGSYPIENCGDASNAIHAIGRTPAKSRSAVEAHIRSRVKSLGCSGSTFDNWK